jgi:hypothetical protein
LLIVLFTVLIGPALLVLFGTLMRRSSVFVAPFVLSLLAEVGVLIMGLLQLIVPPGGLDEKFRDASNGNVDAVVPGAHSALRWAFSRRVRVNAYFLLGITAEARGDFVDAADAFAHALELMSVGHLAGELRRVASLTAGHHALCVAGTGRPDDARVALAQAEQLLTVDLGPAAREPQQAGAYPFRQGSDPRAVTALAAIATAHANGAYRDALDTITHEAVALDHGLLPRERNLVLALERSATTALGAAGAMRGAEELVGDPNTEDEVWAARYLSGP